MEDIQNENNYDIRKKYIIFPLNILSLNFQYAFLLNCILDYYIVEEIIMRINKEYDVCNTAITYQQFKAYHKQVKEMQDKFNRNRVYNLWNIYLRHKIIRIQNKKIERRYKSKDAKVKFHIELLCDILNKSALTERQFRILCSIYSKLGVKKVNVVYNYEIRLRAFGYKSQKISDEEKLLNKINIPNLSNKVLHKEILYLKEGKYSRSFFDSVNDGRRNYYSIFIRGEELEKYVAAKLMINKLRRETERIRNKKFRDKVNKQLKSKLTENEIKEIYKVLETGRNKKYFNISDKKKSIERNKRLKVALINIGKRIKEN